MKNGMVAICVLVFCLLVGVGSARGDVDCPTGTPGLQTEYPTGTPWPTATWVTPTDAPTETPIGEPTPTVGVSPDPSATATLTPRSPDGEDEPDPTWDCHNNYDEQHCLAQTGGGMPPNVALGLIAIGTVVFAFVILLARAGRRAR